MFTPAISSEIAKSGCVTSRAQPPRCWRRGEMLNEDRQWAGEDFNPEAFDLAATNAALQHFH
jgi:hypothetical protein